MILVMLIAQQTVVSIRAYAVQQRFRRDMFDYIDRWTRASNAFYNLNRCDILHTTIRSPSLTTFFVLVDG